MPTETAEFRLLVQGGLANKTLDDVRNRALGLGGGLDRVVGGLDKIGGKAGADAEKATRALGFALGNTGGRASELLGVVGDLAGALSGGGLAIGLTAVAAAGTYAWTKYEEALAEVTTNGKAVDETVARLHANFTDASNARLASAAASVKQLADAVNTFGKSSQQIAVENVLSKQLDVEERLSALRMKRNRMETDTIPDRAVLGGLSGKIDVLEREKRQLDADLVSAREHFARYNKLVDDEKARLRMAQDAAKDAQFFEQRQKETLDHLAEYFSDTDAFERRQREAQAIEADRQRNALLEGERKYFEQIEKLREEKQKGLERQNAEWARSEERAAEKRIAQKKRDAEEEKSLEETRREQIEADARLAIGIVTDATQQLIDATIQGQEHALEHFASFIMRQTGTALVGKGVQLMAEGVASALTPGLQAAAGPQLGAGSLMIAGGLALGGFATGIESSIASMASGNTASGFGAASAARDPGVNTSSTTTGARNEPTTVHVHFEYGVGPAPEKMARDLQRALSYGQAHRIIPRGSR